MDVLGIAGLILASYAAGSVPWGVVLGRGIRHVDLTRHGSGGTGATNAWRVLGWRISLAVFLLDFLKGLVPVLVARWAGLDGWIVAVVGVAAVVGHCWSPWIGFRGGKGMATGAGACVGMFPWILLVLPLMVLVVVLTRYVSLGSLVGSLAASAIVVLLGFMGYVAWSIAVAILVCTAIIVVKHHGNIRRLVNGTERRFGEKATPSAPANGAT